MTSFDFITDDDLRASLESDAAEMVACLKVEAYKAVHVLAGSIVEALLVDHLDSTGYKAPHGADLVELGLGQLIAAARSQKPKVLSDKAADLASVVKEYRNLIHPGRLSRLQDHVDASTAAIATLLVDVVTSEVASLKRDTYGYTAQQVVSKVENDSSSMAILADLLKGTKPKGLTRLLLGDLPTRYMELSAVEERDPDFYAPILLRFRRAYRAAFAAAPENVRRRVTEEYARVLREEVSEFDVLTREEALFRAEDLAYVSPEEAGMVKRHLLARVGRVLPEGLADALTGIGKHADALELTELVDAYVRSVSTRDTPAHRQLAAALLERLWEEAPSETDGLIPKRLEAWQRTFANRSADLAEWLAERISGMTAKSDLDDLPF